MKVSEKLEAAHAGPNSKATFSFEFFVPKTSQGVQNLYDRMDRMYGYQPQFIDITWNAGGRLSNLTTEMIHTAQTVLGLETCMHLTCTNMSLDILNSALKSAYESGCQNILALRGDPPEDGSESTGDFSYAKDLIKHIRKNYGSHFNIGIAAYPEGHPEETDPEKLMKYLREKQDAGGDFIITQMFYDADLFIEWCGKCREAGITIPIIPGIMPISTYASFQRRAKWCEVNVPEHFYKSLEAVKDDDQAVRAIGTKLIAGMCQKLLDSGYVNHLHFYTMNLEKSTLLILEHLGLVEHIDSQSPVPWRQSLNPSRKEEAIRPIFWKNRKFSYISRTSQWDEFPNGRWGDSRSPAFGDIDSAFHDSYGLIRHTPKRVIELWGLPQTTEELSEVFVRYLQGKIHSLPWCDGPITKEVDPIKEQLISLNSRGVFTINSQPCINGVDSHDKVHGWGPKNGLVYQKQYFEFLLHKDLVAELINRISQTNEKYQYNALCFYAVDASGNLETNADEEDINAVTWGCFPGCQILQPTIVERISFLAWKDEAFRILKEWSSVLRRVDSETENQAADKVATEKLLDRVSTDYYLFNIVDNDFVKDKNAKIYPLFEGLV